MKAEAATESDVLYDINDCPEQLGRKTSDLGLPEADIRYLYQVNVAAEVIE